ncbi:MAG: bifunctional nuclease family protein [Dehalococcoidia bacterium]
MIEMTIDSVRVIPEERIWIILLKEKYADLYLPVLMSPREAQVIAAMLQGLCKSCSLTYDLLGRVIDTLGGTVRYVLVGNLPDKTPCAKIVVQANGDGWELDSRPSDALALAVQVQAPIYANAPVLRHAWWVLDQERNLFRQLESDSQEALEKPPTKKVEELSRLSSFSEFIDTLDLEDFGK